MRAPHNKGRKRHAKAEKSEEETEIKRNDKDELWGEKTIDLRAVASCEVGRVVVSLVEKVIK